MSDCIFCKIISGEIPSNKIYEDEDFIAILDIAPVNPGHALVVTKLHYGNFLETPEEVVKKLISVIKKITPAILRGVGAENFNLFNNSGEIAGQSILHLHWHIVPRFAGDGWEMWHGHAYLEEEADKVLKNIKKQL